jgi:hypothetical protein
VFWVTIGSNTTLHLTLINLFSVVTQLKGGHIALGSGASHGHACLFACHVYCDFG